MAAFPPPFTRLGRRLPAAVSREVERVRRASTALGPYPADAALALLVLGTMVALLRIDRDGVTQPVAWYAYPLIGAASLPLIWRRRWPFSTALLVSLAAITYDRMPGLPSQHLQYGALVGVYTVADRGPRLIRRWVPMLCLVGLLASGVSVGDLLYGNMFPLLSLLTAYVMGCSARTRRAYADALEARAEQLARERDLEADRAALRERERIAREMHDILGHAVSLMVVQAEAGPVVVRRDPDRAVAAFDAIADAGRDAMAQLRRLLGLLNRPGGDEAERAPQAGLDTIPELAARVRDTGLRVELTASGTPVPVPADVSLAAYRLVQESLTNTVRHAGASRADIRIGWSPGVLAVEVCDDGVGKGGPGTSTGGAEQAGFGLVGLAHRVEAAGGALVTGPGADGGGFRVTARFPLDVAADEGGGEHHAGGPKAAGAAGTADAASATETADAAPDEQSAAAYAKLTP